MFTWVLNLKKITEKDLEHKISQLPCFTLLPIHSTDRTLLKSHLPARPHLGDPIKA